MKSIASHRPSRSARAEQANQSKRVDDLSIVIHRENLYHIASGHRVVSPRLVDGAIVLETLYGAAPLQYTAGQFRNGYGSVVTI